jgi:serine/threonine protein kinase
MELVEGSTLRRILDAQTLTAAQTCALFEQLLAATAFAHERGVIHRDLKPDNVFVTPDGTVKLADFGIAHLGGAGTTLTTAGTLLGTPAYMAPEQIRGEPVDARCDVFALGVMAYECLAGRHCMYERLAGPCSPS